MKFSILIATMNREKDIIPCIESVLNQNFKDYEIVIIDQSDNNLTEKAVENFKKDFILYKHIQEKGLSLSRNIGIKMCKGDFICFLDDDATYSLDFLWKANEILKKNKELIAIMGRIYDKNTDRYLLKSMEREESFKIPPKNYNIIASSAFIINRQILLEQGLFDEKLGVGGQFGSCEENDLISRLMYKNENIYYYPEILMYHPVGDSIELDKVYQYATGYGAYVKKHYKYFNNKSCFKDFLAFEGKNFLKMIVYLLLFNKYKFNFKKSEIGGAIEGFRKYQ